MDQQQKFPWTFVSSVHGELKPPRFAPDAILACRVQLPGSLSYSFVAAKTELIDSSVTRITATVHTNDMNNSPAFEFGWVADSAFLMLASPVD